MVDIAIQNAPSGLDALTASRSGRSANQDDNGKAFLLALSGSGGGGRQPASSAAKDDGQTAPQSDSDANADTAPSSDPSGAATAADTTTAEDASMATNAAGSPTDVKGQTVPTGLKTPPLLSGFPKSLLGLQKPALADQSQPTDAAPSTDVMPAVDAANPTGDPVQQLAATVPTDQIAQVPAVQTDATDPDKAVKTTDSADSKPTDTPAPDASGAVSDALSLLNVPQVNAAPAILQTVAAAFAAADTQTPAEPAPEQPLSKVATDKMTSLSDVIGTDAAPATTTDGAAQTFKLVRANGRSGSMDMSIGKGSDDTAQLDVKTTTGGTGDTITVLDSRRFLGLADGSNSSLVTGALSGDKEWAATMRSSSAMASADSATSTGKVVNTLKIQMNPIDLGLVTANMRLSGDQLTVDLKVQSAEAYRQLTNDQSKMVDALRAQGFAVDRITVSMSPAASDGGDRQSQPGFQGQQSQQQSTANQGQGSEAQARRQGYTGQQTNGNDSGRSSKDVAVDDGVSGGSQRGRSGSVYL
ncbi:flagellar hook-length control protein FliK [Rhizobium tubonense]|uniref:Chemotaxis protein n=1 Tax=Rhizobium tubonense TaxID=484088 RepID=A0A2W4CG15_9HYPH|nr:flagellar hook-length control protein FliK [Rhizobium tubonense]PZM11992.1 chemotaxis protein [Rhizobium tubonense]